MENILKRLMMSASSGCNNLPPEIIEAILLRLPAKSVGRFKSVSKTWNSLISDPRFIKNHVHGIQNNQYLKTTNFILVSSESERLLYSINPSIPILHLDKDYIPVTPKELSIWLPRIQWHDIIGSCNGLVLAFGEKNDMLLMNPTIKELLEIPCFLNYKYPDVCAKGFGYDSITDDYKLVLISLRDPETLDYFASIYSFRKNSWKELPITLHVHVDSFKYGAVFVSHNFHWAATESTILAFSLTDEVFNVIKLPGSFIKNEHGVCYVVELGGKLGIYLQIEVGYELWVMQEYGNCKSWTKIWVNKNPGNPSFSRPLCLIGGNNRDIVMDDGDGCVSVYIYNIDERNYKCYYSDGLNNVECSFVKSIETPTRFVSMP